MNPYRISKHMSREREERIFAILDRTGLGEEMASEQYIDKIGKLVTTIITTTGIILHLNEERTVITAYVATIKQAQAMFPRGHVPTELYPIIKKNQKRFADIIDKSKA